MGLKMKLKRREVFGLTKGNLLHDLHNTETQCLLSAILDWTTRMIKHHHRNLRFLVVHQAYPTPLQEA